MLLTTGCQTSILPVNRDPPPTPMLQRPGAPQLAPENPTDNEIADERVRFGAHIRLLERKFDGLYQVSIPRTSSELA